MKKLRISYILFFCLLFIFIIPFLASAAVVKLAWDPSNEEDLAGYKIYYGYDTRDYNTSIDVGKTTTFQVTDLKYDQTYYFAVTAYNNSNLESDYSDEISYIPKSDSGGDGLTEEDEINIYGTDPNNPDTDSDDINDGDEVAFWGSDWDMDYDNDGIVNLLDPDSDNDGFLDGLEISSGFDPSDPNSTPPAPDDESGGLFVCDAEEGDNSDFDGTFTQGSNTFTATESAKNNGNYGYAAGFDGSSDEVYAYKDFSDQSDVYARFYFKIPSDFHLEGNWVKIPVFQLMDEGTSLVIFYLTEANPGKYGWSAELWNPYAPIAGEWRSLSANRWYMVEIRWKQDPLEGGAEIWIDDVPVGGVYTEDTSMRNANSIQVGRGYTGYGDPGALVTSGAIYFDDIKVDTSHIDEYSDDGLDDENDVLFVCDAEEGDNSDFDGTFTQGSNTFTATESAKNNGNYGYAAGFDGSSDEVYAYKDFSDQSDVYARFYFKIPSDFHLEGNWVKIPVFQLMDGGTSLVIFYLTEANPGKYGWSAELWNPYAPIAGEWRSLSANTWYMVEIRWKQDPLEGGAEIWIDDVPVGGVYTEDTSMRNANSIQVGRGYTGYGDPGVLVTSGAIYFDDIKIDASHE